MIDDERFLSEELASIEIGLEAARGNLVEFCTPDMAIEKLIETWDIPQAPVVCLRETAPRYPPTTSGYYVGWSPEFLKSTQNIDRKLQGRTYQAIAEISREPTTPRGDTVKPLTSGLKGLWRYRIGDFRLVYHPDSESRHVTLITFAGRGNVYG